MRSTLLLSRVHLDIYNITDLEGGEVCRQWNNTMLLEVTLEQMTSCYVVLMVSVAFLLIVCLVLILLPSCYILLHHTIIHLLRARRPVNVHHARVSQ